MRFLTAFLICCFINQPSFAAFDAPALYGERIAFDVLRNDKVVGEHVTQFRTDNGDLIVTSRMNIDIFALFIPLYAFDYRSQEIWRANQLAALDVNVIDGNDKTSLQANRTDKGLDVDIDGRDYLVDGPVFTTNHWNSLVVQERKVLNTLTGNMNDVQIINKGVEEIDVLGGKILATRYDYEGELKDTSVWYDDKGRWVKLRFKARDGSMIDYRCRTCIEKGGTS